MLSLIRSLTLLNLLLLCCMPLLAQSPNGFEQTATSSIKAGLDNDGNILITTINRHFTLADLYKPGLIESLVLLEEFKSERHPGMEGQKSIVRVDAWLAPDLSKKLWTIEQAGDVGRVDDDFYRITKYGCCASLPTDFYFNLRTGRRLFSATKELSQIIVPNTDPSLTRYVAYHSADGIISPMERQKDANITGLFQYGSDNEVLLKIAVRSNVEAIASIKLRYQNKLDESNRLMLWGVDGKKDKSSLSYFAIVISYGWAGDIVLPVMNDNIELSRATIPSRFKLEVVK